MPKRPHFDQPDPPTRFGPIDWTSTCIYVGCDRPKAGPATEIQLCHTHAIEAWNWVQRYRGHPTVIETAQQVRDRLCAEMLERERQEQEQEAARRKSRRERGRVYVVRLNGLIKVGWSSDLWERIRAYGPSVEVLCHCPGTRQEETDLHRAFRPFLAHGREWYHESQVITDYVAATVAEHGQPYVHGIWTQPKNPAVRVRKPHAMQRTGGGIAAERPTA